MDELPIQLPPGGVDRIISFLGYGQPSAPVWFIGIEEGLGRADSTDTIDNLEARAKFDPIMDLRDAHLRLCESGRPIDIEKKTSFTQVWLFMAKIMRAHEGHHDWSDKERAKEYVRAHLGRKNGRSFLTELSPIPSAKAHDKKWMSLFTRMEPDITNKLEKRRENLRRELSRNDPSLVVCYGSGLGIDFAKLLGVEWRFVFNEVSTSQNGKCLLLPFFGNGHMSHPILQALLDRGLLQVNA
jgi:hypothetical protein